MDPQEKSPSFGDTFLSEKYHFTFIDRCKRQYKIYTFYDVNGINSRIDPPIESSHVELDLVKKRMVEAATKRVEKAITS